MIRSQRSSLPKVIIAGLIGLLTVTPASARAEDRPLVVDLDVSDSRAVLLGDPHAITELVQESFEDAHRKLSRSEGRVVALRVRGLNASSGNDAHITATRTVLDVALTELAALYPEAYVSAIDVPIEPEQVTLDEAKSGNEILMPIIERLDAFVTLENVDPAKVEASLPEAGRLRADRPILFRHDGNWHVDGGFDETLSNTMFTMGSIGAGALRGSTTSAHRDATRGAEQLERGDSPNPDAKGERQRHFTIRINGYNEVEDGGTEIGDGGDDHGHDQNDDGGDDGSHDDGSDDQSDDDSDNDGGDDQGDDGSDEESFQWTTLTPSQDTRFVYVSSSEGDDDSLGQSENSPVRTLARAIELMRNGFPDWMLLKRGDVWENESFGTWIKSGRDENQPMVITGYGTDPARPVIQSGSTHGLQTKVTVTIRHLAFVGLHFHGKDRPGDDGATGFRWLSAGGDLLLEDCVFEGYADNIDFQDYPEQGLYDVRLRRNIIIDSFSTSGHSQGIFAHQVQGFLIEECIFDHNGYNESIPGAEPTDFNHNLYIKASCTDVVLKGNIVINGSAAGIQARSGGLVENNLFISNPIALRYGGGDDPVHGGVSGQVRYNIFLESDDITDSLPRGHGITAQNVSEAIIEYNMFLKDDSFAPYGHAVYFEGDRSNEVGVHNIHFHRNTIYNWRGGLRYSGDVGSQLSNITVDSNIVHVESDEKPLVRHDDAISPEFYMHNNNAYFTNRADSKWFFINSVNYAFPQWVAIVEEQGAENDPVEFASPDYSVEGYAQSIGLGDSLSDFTAALRQQSKGTWNEALNVSAIRAYFEEGFAPMGTDEDGLVGGVD